MTLCFVVLFTSLCLSLCPFIFPIDFEQEHFPNRSRSVTFQNNILSYWSHGSSAPQFTPELGSVCNFPAGSPPWTPQFPLHSQKHASRWTGFASICINSGLNECMNVCVSADCPVMDWHHIQSVFSLRELPNASDFGEYVISGIFSFWFSIKSCICKCTSHQGM